jgi:hypothetical protein
VEDEMYMSVMLVIEMVQPRQHHHYRRRRHFYDERL